MAAGSLYSGVGLSTELDLSELPPIVKGRFELEVLGLDTPVSSPTSWVHHWTSNSLPVLSLSKISGRHVLAFNDGRMFEFDREARTVSFRLPLDASAQHQLLDHVLPRVLDDLGHLMVHGSAIGSPARVVVFIGESGVGKSTLAASFHDAGVGLLSDDCMRLNVEADGAITCIPTYRSLRLWPDSADAVVPTAGSEPMSENSEKRQLSLPIEALDCPATVAAICVLAKPDERSGAVTFAALSPARAVSLLLAQCFRLDPTDAEATKRAFERCADVVERVPVVELSYPRLYERLPEVREAVLQRVASGDWTTVTAT